MTGAPCAAIASGGKANALSLVGQLSPTVGALGSSNQLVQSLLPFRLLRHYPPPLMKPLLIKARTAQWTPGRCPYEANGKL